MIISNISVGSSVMLRHLRDIAVFGGREADGILWNIESKVD